MTGSLREGQTFVGDSLLVRYVNLVKLPHTLFALPFALLGVLAASRVAAVTARTVALVVIAFSAARWAAMGFNRIADLPFDVARLWAIACCPRTSCITKANRRIWQK